MGACEESHGTEIGEAWHDGVDRRKLDGVVETLRTVMQRLAGWSQEKFGSVRKELEELRRKLAKLQGSHDATNEAQFWTPCA